MSKNNKKTALYITSGVLAFIIIIMLFLPLVVKTYINKNGKEILGRTVHIETIKLNYFTTTLQVGHMTLFEANDSTPFVSFDHFLVNIKPLKLLSEEIFIQRLRLTHLDANILQCENGFNYSDLEEFYATDSTITVTEEDDETTEYKLNLNNIEILQSYVKYTDKELDHTLNIEDLSFIIPSIKWNMPDSSNADLEFMLPNDGHFSSRFNYNIEDGRFEGYAAVKNIDLGLFLPYMQEFITTSKVEGRLDAKIDFDGVDTMDEFTIKGKTTIADFKLFDDNNKKVLGTDTFTVDLASLDPLSEKVEIDLIEFNKPYIYFALIDSLSNFDKMLVPSEEIAQENTDSLTEAEVEPMDVKVNRFTVKDGLVDFSDQTLREEFLYELSEISINTDTIKLENSWVNITSDMKLNKRGDLKAEISINPSDVLDSIQMNYVLTNFLLTDLNIYSKEFVGLPILFGDMYYVNNTSIINQQISSENKLIISNAELGRKSGGIYDIPVKLALFILKDKNGDITLDVPVKGDLSDPETKIGPIVWNTLKNLTVKLATSPFKAFGNMFNADAESFKELTFSYGDTILVNKQTKTLDLLLKLEDEKPELQITLQYFNDKELERTDVAKMITHDIYYEATGDKAKNNRNEYIAYLAELTAQDSLTMQDYEMMIAPPTEVDSLLQLNETIRINNVRNYLFEKDSTSTIHLIDYSKDEVLNIGSRPKFNITYTLREDE